MSGRKEAVDDAAAVYALRRWGVIGCSFQWGLPPVFQSNGDAVNWVLETKRGIAKENARMLFDVQPNVRPWCG